MLLSEDARDDDALIYVPALPGVGDGIGAGKVPTGPPPLTPAGWFDDGGRK